jgi:hypothetical protein
MELAISEVFNLADHHPLATIIITADVDPERAKAIQHHYLSFVYETLLVLCHQLNHQLSSFQAVILVPASPSPFGPIEVNQRPLPRPSANV